MAKYIVGRQRGNNGSWSLTPYSHGVSRFHTPKNTNAMLESQILYLDPQCQLRSIVRIIVHQRQTGRFLSIRLNNSGGFGRLFSLNPKRRSQGFVETQKRI